MDDWSSAVGGLFGAGVACVLDHDTADLGELDPAERALVANAVDDRRRQFAAGRRAARRALVAIGVAPAPILAGPHGEPRWPAGVAGTIAHTDGLVGAAVCRTDGGRTLGLDLERLRPRGRERDLDLSRAVVDDHERALLDGLDVRVVWSCKEAAYKCLFPWVGRPFVLRDLRLIAIDPSARAILLAGPVLAEPVRCRYLVRDGVVAAAAELTSGHVIVNTVASDGVT